MRAHLLVAIVVAALGAGGCEPKVEVDKGLQISVVSTGWFDSGIVNGQNKLVPSITFTVKNVSTEKLTSVQVNALFRRTTDKDEWGSGFVTAAGSSGLAPGAETSPITVRSDRGYTGTESRQDMLKNSQFVDAKVDLFAKFGSKQLTKMGAYPIKRELVTQ